jgi:hypothetical protein
MSKKPKLHFPKCATKTVWTATARREAIAMERHVTGFIPQNQSARLSKRLIRHMPFQNAIISSADQFCEQENLKLERDAEKAAAQTKRAETPMAVNSFSAEAIHRAAKQSSVFFFLVKPSVNNRANLRIFAAKIL